MTTIQRPQDTARTSQDNTMTTTVPTRGTDPTTDRAPAVPSHRMHWNWFGVWAFLTSFAVFEVVKHGYVNGSALDAIALTATAFGFFVAPDLTFFIGAGQPVTKGHLAPRAVRWYNAMHRISVPLVLTSIIGVALAPLAFGPLALFIGGLSWMAHIALDRTAGYGLRNPDGSRGHS
ncbi:MAG: DUF4260 domain-containing protein [Acidimicrobiia bacterium]|nr:DUF4260 domain-containing protein [Acidimicrobiia bacterium]